MAKKKTEVELTPEELAKKEVETAKENVAKKMKSVQDDTQPDEVSIGTVSNCARLNVRKSPRLNATVVQIIDDGAKVQVLTGFENKEFYKVITANGVRGFCMKKFIKLKK